MISPMKPLKTIFFHTTMRVSHTCKPTLLLQTLKLLRLQSFQNMQFMELVLYALEVISLKWAHPTQFVLGLGFCICNENFYESGTQISYIVWFFLHICNVNRWIEISTEEYLAVTFFWYLSNFRAKIMYVTNNMIVPEQS